jgi:hypothetical protein
VEKNLRVRKKYISEVWRVGALLGESFLALNI